MPVVPKVDSVPFGEWLLELEELDGVQLAGALGDLRNKYPSLEKRLHILLGGARDEWTRRILSGAQIMLDGSSSGAGWFATVTMAATALKNGRAQIWNDGSIGSLLLVKKFTVESVVGGLHVLTQDNVIANAQAGSPVQSAPVNGRNASGGADPWGNPGGAAGLQGDITLGVISGTPAKSVRLAANSRYELGNEGAGFCAVLQKNCGLSWWCGVQNQALDVHAEFLIIP